MPDKSLLFDDPLMHDLHNKASESLGSLLRMVNRLPGITYRCKISQDFRYTLTFVSKGAESILGLTVDEMLDARTNVLESLFIDEDRQRVRRIMQDAILARKAYEGFYRIRTPVTGEIKWIWDQGEGIFDDAGECHFVEGIMMDVTEQKQKEYQLWQENEILRSSIKHSYGLSGMVGKSPAMQSCYRRLLRAANTATNVVLYGETGVGKDLAARTMHEISGVKGRFVPVNCAAIPEQLLESEFFGHVKGAFSGATSNQSGYLEAADGGTLFLDEVGELPLKLQGKLLRAIESKTYTPVGAREPRRSSFRLISATNRNLQELVDERAMRLDFYYRIHVLSITIPPLRERLEDLPLLVDAYAKKHNINKFLPAALLQAMEQYDWPGNVRELQNALDRYWAFGEMDIHLGESSRELIYIPGPDNGSQAVPQLKSVKNEVEKQRIRATLEQNNWRRKKSAEALGITTRTLYRKIQQYNLAKQSR